MNQLPQNGLPTTLPTTPPMTLLTTLPTAPTPALPLLPTAPVQAIQSSNTLSTPTPTLARITQATDQLALQGNFGREITNLAKLYTDEVKYSSE